MRGIVLAGGTGSRMWPATLAISKQLIPVYDRPMIYYSICMHLMSGIRDILIISTPQDTPRFQQLLGDGSRWGISFSYAVQPEPQGVAEAFVIGSEFVGNHSSSLALGDNIFYGRGLRSLLQKASALDKGAKVLACPVDNPGQYGVVVLDKDGVVREIEEKPDIPRSDYAIPGLYFYDSTVCEKARSINCSSRGEWEITALNRIYLDEGRLSVEILEDNVAWVDAGTPEALLDASRLVERIDRHSGAKLCCPEEICWELGYIDSMQLETLAGQLRKSRYGRYLLALLHDTCAET